MGRRGVMTMSKMVLPTVSWVAVMRLLKKAPKSLPASQPGMGAEIALKAFMGCSTAPQTDSLRYADDYLAQTKGRRGGGRRPKPAALLPSCTSRPHNDSFRVHHVVNQEALQLMLTFHDDDDDDAEFDYEAFFESDELSYGIIRDGDRLLHDDICADDSACGSSSMGTCSSRLSASTSRSLMASSAYSTTTLSRNSVDSEGVYSTATSASFGNRAPELLNIGHHITCNSTPSSSIVSSCGASELIYSEEILDHELKLAAREELEEEQQQQLGEHDAEEDDDACSAHNDWDVEAQESKRDHIHSCAEDGLLHAASWSAGYELDVDDAGDDHENYEGDAEDEEEDDEETVAEMRYSEDPLEDFAEAISRMVVSQQLNKAAQLQELYCRFLRLNAPSLHRTITLAFLHALQRLASFEPHLLPTLI